MRKGDLFWSGLWSDMTIVHILTSSAKSCGGMTRRKRVTSWTLAK